MPRKLVLENYLKVVPDFPKPGINYLDIQPLLASPKAFGHAINQLSEPLQDEGIEKVVGFDARGFILAGALAVRLGAGVIMLRKQSKLPGTVHRTDYDLEYGSSALEIQCGVLDPNDSVLMVDDVIATGGTALAGIELVQRCGARVADFCALIDLEFLEGSQRIADAGVPVRSLIKIEEL